MSSLGSGRRWASLGLGLAVTALFTWLTLRKVDTDEVLRVSSHAALGLMACSLFPKAAGFGFLALRSRILLRPLGTWSYAQVLRSVFVGFAGNTVLPFRIGELLRVGYLARTGAAHPAACLSVVLLERLLDLATLVVLFFVIVPLVVVEVDGGRALPVLAAATTLVLLAGVGVARRPSPVLALARRLLAPLPVALAERAGRLAEGLVSGLAGLSSPLSVVGAIIATLLYWACSAASAAIWFYAFDLHLPWTAAFLFLFGLALGTFLPSSPGAVGTWHYFAVTSLVMLQVDREVATSLAILGHALAFVPFTVLALPVLLPDLLAWWRADPA